MDRSAQILPHLWAMNGVVDIHHHYFHHHQQQQQHQQQYHQSRANQPYPKACNSVHISDRQLQTQQAQALLHQRNAATQQMPMQENQNATNQHPHPRASLPDLRVQQRLTNHSSNPPQTYSSIHRKTTMPPVDFGQQLMMSTSYEDLIPLQRHSILQQISPEQNAEHESGSLALWGGEYSTEQFKLRYCQLNSHQRKT